MSAQKVAIVGSRCYHDLEAVRNYVASMAGTGAIIISGGAAGVDLTAERTAKACGMATKIFLADWDKHGKRAGFIRNELIVKVADRVVAFWDGKSRGTKDTIDRARRVGIPVEVIGAQSTFDFGEVSC